MVLAGVITIVMACFAGFFAIVMPIDPAARPFLSPDFIKKWRYRYGLLAVGLLIFGILEILLL